jgi:gamma-glutamyl:cysteine ligase YbdK (ATP-grasp superfamily)
MGEMEAVMGRLEAIHDFSRSYYEVGPLDMPLDVYPDPAGRYAAIAARIPGEVLRAACRVIGTHVHVGMGDHETALEVYNRVRTRWGALALSGDCSWGKRLELYAKMAPQHAPPHYESWEDFYQQLVIEGGAGSPRDCYHMIRLSGHGTIEFRMFGSVASIKKVNEWAQRCYELCEKALVG